MKLKSGFSEYSDDDLLHLGETVGANIPTIAKLSTLKPTGPDVAAGAAGLQGAKAMVGLGRAEAIIAARETLSDLLSDVAANAPQIAGVTDTDLAEIGIPKVQAPTRATQPPDACGNLRLFHGQNQGEVTARCDPPDNNIRVYEAQWTLDPNGSTWSDTATFPNSRSIKFSGLARGKDVWVRVRARNSIGAGPWSDPATIMVT